MRVRKGLRKVKMCGHVMGEFPKHRTNEFKKTRRKYLVIISVSPALWRPELHGCVFFTFVTYCSPSLTSKAAACGILDTYTVEEM